jgi:hypothetical protein
MLLRGLRGSAPDAGKIPGVLGMQNVLNGVSMAVGVMEKAFYSSYTPTKFPIFYFGRSKKSIVIFQ